MQDAKFACEAGVRREVGQWLAEPTPEWVEVSLLKEFVESIYTLQTRDVYNRPCLVEPGRRNRDEFVPHLMRYEHKSCPLLPWRQFLIRQLFHFAIAAGLLSFSLALGVVGYYLAGLSCIDALHSASMMLSGKDPVGGLSGTAGNVVASVYAVYSGIVFPGAFTVILAPAVHRLHHRLHLEGEGDGGGRDL